MKKAILVELALSVLLLCAHTSSAVMDDSAALYAKLKNGVVKLEIDELTVPLSSGSGFFVSADGWVVTNRHVFQDAVNKGHGLTISTLEGFKTKQYQVGGCSENTDLDLCLIKIDFKPKFFFALDAKVPEQVGQHLYVIGHPIGFNYSMTDGVLSGLREQFHGKTVDRGSLEGKDRNSGVKVIQISASISPGNSGGPIFDAKGNLLGVATFYRQGGQNLNFGMDASEVAAFVQSHKKPQKVDNYQKSISSSLSKFYSGLELAFAGKVMTTKMVRLGAVVAELPNFIADTCKLALHDKAVTIVHCKDDLAEGGVEFGMTNVYCPLQDFPSFPDCIRQKVTKNVDHPTPVRAMQYLLKNSPGKTISASDEYAISKPGIFDCHWSGDHEICTLKIENDEAPGALGIWTFYRDKTVHGVVFSRANYKNAESEKYARLVSNTLSEKLSQSVMTAEKRLEENKVYKISGIVLKPELIRPDGAPAYLAFNLKTQTGNTYSVMDYTYPLRHIKPGKEMRAGNIFTYKGHVFPDPSRMTRGILRVTHRLIKPRASQGAGG